MDAWTIILLIALTYISIKDMREMVIHERILVISLILGFTATASRALFITHLVDVIAKVSEHIAASIYSLMIMLLIKPLIMFYFQQAVIFL